MAEVKLAVKLFDDS